MMRPTRRSHKKDVQQPDDQIGAGQPQPDLDAVGQEQPHLRHRIGADLAQQVGHEERADDKRREQQARRQHSLQALCIRHQHSSPPRQAAEVYAISRHFGNRPVMAALRSEGVSGW
jgi:hypothetical protein